MDILGFVAQIVAYEYFVPAALFVGLFLIAMRTGTRFLIAGLLSLVISGLLLELYKNFAYASTIGAYIPLYILVGILVVAFFLLLLRHIPAGYAGGGFISPILAALGTMTGVIALLTLWFPEIMKLYALPPFLEAYLRPDTLFLWVFASLIAVFISYENSTW